MNLIRHMILSIAANAIAIWAVTYLLPEDISVYGGIWGFIVVGFLLGILNTLIKPILKLIGLPFMVITMGLFSIVVNMIILWILQWIFANILQSLEAGIIIMGGFASYLLVAILLGILNAITEWLLVKKK